MNEWDTADGLHILKVHYTADPKKQDPNWIAEARAGSTPEDWAIEMEIDFSVTRGAPWYPEFNPELHVAKGPLAPLRGVALIAGLDYGLTPATVYIQAAPDGRVVVHAPDLQSWESGIVAHANKMLAVQAANFPGFKIHYYGDPAGNQRVQTDEKTVVQVLRQDFGINVRNGPVSFAQREIPIRKLLTSLIGGKPALLIDPRCVWLIEALKGGYKRMEVNDQILDKLEDNKYTHIVDAFSYAVSMLKYAGDDNDKFVMPALGRM
jgi:hypothetical protein